MSTEPIRIGLLSFAHGHAHSYTDCLQKCPSVEVVGIFDDNKARGQQAADHHRVPLFVSAQALLQQGLDGVIICAENGRHRAMVEVAAPFTRHILCEKPIATTLADAQAMIDLCAQSGTKLQVAFPVRYSPPIQWLKDLLNKGELGQVFAVQTTNHGSMPGDWFIDKQLAGGGAVMDHTVHVIDLLRWFWQAEVTEVYAEVGQDLVYPGLGIDDVGLLSFTLSNGIYGTLDTSWSRPPSYTTWGDVKIEVTAEKGVVFVDAFQQKLAVSSNQLGKTRWHNWGSNMDQGLINDFIAMIRSGHAPSISGLDGLRALEVALAAYQSAQVGQPISLPLSS